MNKKEQRGPWYLLTGLVIGLILGVVYSWVFQPLEYVDTSPDSLREDFKDHYRALIASAYMSNGDLVRARARLELLQDEDIYRALTEQAQRTLAEQGASDEARALGLLAIALGQDISGQGQNSTPFSQEAEVTALQSSSLTVSFTATSTHTLTFTPSPMHTNSPTPQPSAEGISDSTSTTTAEFNPSSDVQLTPTETPIPRPTATLTLTFTPTRTPGVPFVLVKSEKICDRSQPEPLIYIYAWNASEEPASGVEVIVTWVQGEERFFTGLKPEKGLGYADFSPVPGSIYALRLGERGEPVTGLSAVTCQNSDGSSYWGAWMLEFIQP